ncbi:MAG: hypothetical protein ABR602_06960 [Gemmatimonadales bacterium]
MSRGREGFTLAELLVVLVLMIPLWTAATGLAANATRAATRAAYLANVESAIAQATAILAAELGDAGVLLIEPARVRVHASRGVGAWCRADSAGVVVALTDWAASRLPVAGRDSLVLERVANDSSGWRESLRLPLSGPPAAEPCATGVAGLRLPADLTPLFLPGLRPGPLVRTTEVIELRAYASGGDTWFGIQHLGIPETVQPAAGPFDSGGLLFEGVDAAGSPTADPALVRAVRIRFRTPGLPPVEREVIVGLRG